MSKARCIYMIVSRDTLKLPMFVGTAEEVAEKAGVSKNTIYSSISHYERGEYPSCSYRRVYERETEKSTSKCLFNK